MERFEYTTMAWACGEPARMLAELNDLGSRGWEVCAHAEMVMGAPVIGRVPPDLHKVPVLLLKRRVAEGADGLPRAAWTRRPSWWTW